MTGAETKSLWWTAELKVVLVALAAATAGVVAGSMAGARAQAPEPWPAPEVCNDELLADYAERERLIGDLMMDLRECRLRYGGCAPGSTWVIDERRRRWREAHPEIVRREEEARERWHREMETEMEAEERAETGR